MINMDKEILIKKLRKYFKGREDVAFAYLFGSVAKGRTHSESDVDIGIYFTPATRALEYEAEKRYPGEGEIRDDLDKIINREIDMVVLNRASSTLFFGVISEGVKIFSRNEKLFSRVADAVHDLAEEFSEFIFDFVKIKERSKSLSVTDRVRLERLLDFIGDQMIDFKNFSAVNQLMYEDQVSVKRNLERWAETMASASIDIAKILIASAKRPIPQTYKYILKDLAFLEGFDRNVAEKIARFSDLRNLLAHEYLDLRFALLNKFIKEAEPLFFYLINYTKRTLEK